MLINPKYLRFQWQSYTMYTWSIESSEIWNIPETTESFNVLLFMWAGLCAWFIICSIITTIERFNSKKEV